MYPHIFIDNITTGATNIRCDCDNACANVTPKRFEIQYEIEENNKLVNYDVNERSLFDKDSASIENWSRQVTNFYNQTKSVLYLPHTIDESTVPEFTPHESRPTQLFRNKDQSLIGDSNERTGGMELLIDAIDFLDLTKNMDQTTISEYCSGDSSIKISYDEHGGAHDATPMKYETGFENLIMLAEEAVKQIDEEAND